MSTERIDLSLGIFFLAGQLSSERKASQRNTSKKFRGENRTRHANTEIWLSTFFIFFKNRVQPC
jgi:hypothetical protein